MSRTSGTAYGLGSGTKNLNPKYLHVPRAPRNTDKAYKIGTIWIDTLGNNVYFLVGFELGLPLWRSLVSSGTDFKDSVLSIAVATNPPPTSNVGDRYIIDNSGAVNGAWGVGVSNNDIVEFRGSSWDFDTPSEGALVYVEDIDLLYIFNGTEWWDISNAIPDASETQRGVLRTATDGEAIASVVTDEALVPSNLIPVFSSPNPLGDITPNTGGFTQIDLSAVTAPAHEPGRLFYDTDTGALTFYNSESDIALQIGEENWIKVRNESGGDLVNGTVVYLNGSSGGVPLVEEAIASDHSSSHAIAVVTHTIEDNTDGYVTSFGLVRNLNTNLFTGGEPIFLSTTVAGGITTTPPTNKDFIVRVGYIAAVGVSDGSFLVNIEHAGNIEFSHGYTNNPTGFLDPDTDVQISFVDGTRTFTIEPQGASYSYWSEGIRYDKTAPEEIVVPDTNGLHYIYYDGETLIETDTFNLDIITKFAYVSVVDWNVAEAKNIYIADEFKHTTKMGSLTHSYLHNTRGFALEAGGGLADIVADGSGNLDSDAQFGNEATIAWDEDARFSYTARTSTSNIGLYFKEGPDLTFVWNLDDTSSFPLMTAGTGRAAYNELTGGNWVQTEVPNNNFVLAHVFVYNDSGRKYGAIQGEDFYTTISNARDGAETELGDIIAAGRVPDEIKFLGTIIYQTADVYSNTVKSRIRTTDGGFDYIDLRDEPISRGGTGGVITDHGALSGLGDDDHMQYLRTDGTRTLTGPMDFGSQALTNVNIDSGSATGLTEVQVDNITIDGNTITATGDLILNPSGKTILEASIYSALDTMQDSVNTFPAGTENSLMKANIKGLSLFNDVVNGDFSDGTNDWAATRGSITVSSGICSLTADGSGGSAFLESSLAGSSFIRAMVRVTNADCDQIAIYNLSSPTPNIVIDNPEINQWYDLSGFQVSSGSPRFVIIQFYPDAGTANGKVLEVDGNAGVFAINTARLGIDSYTEAQMLDLVQQGYFEGYQASAPDITTAHILAEQSIINGDFSDGTTDWSWSRGVLTTSGNIGSITGDGVSTVPRIFQDALDYNDGHKIFVYFRARATNSDVLSFRFHLAASGMTNVTVTTQTSPVINTWYDNYGIGTLISGGSGDLEVNFVTVYPSSALALNKVTEYDGVSTGLFAIDMTAAGITDKTEAEMLEFVQTTGYFEGEQADRSNTFNPGITLQSLPDGTQDTLQNASDDLSNFIDNWRHTQIVSSGEAITSATTVNTTNFPSMVTGSSFLIVLDAGGFETGVDGDVASGNGSIFYQLAARVVSELEIDQLYSFEDGYLYQKGTLLNQIDFSLSQNITARLDSLEHAVEDIDDRTSSVFVANDPRVKTAVNASGDAPIYAPRAWVNFNGTGVVAIRNSGNVTSITDNNTGDYTVNFTVAMEDANYAISSDGRDSSGGSGITLSLAGGAIDTLANVMTTSLIRVRAIATGDVIKDIDAAFVAIFR